jgi:hypothetical protein
MTMFGARTTGKEVEQRGEATSSAVVIEKGRL